MHLAIFDASGHDGLSAVNRSAPGVLCSGRNPICASSTPATHPPALGLICTPAGNATVVSLMSASPSPTGFTVDSCGTCTSTFKPVGVLPADPSGVTPIVGLKSSLSQPDKLRQRDTHRINVFTRREIPRFFPRIHTKLRRSRNPTRRRIRQKRLHRHIHRAITQRFSSSSFMRFPFFRFPVIAKILPQTFPRAPGHGSGPPAHPKS